MSQPSSTGSMGRALAITGILIFLALLTYTNTFNAPFVFDDLPNITQSPYLRLTQLTPESLSRIFKSQGFRPMANLSFAANYFFHDYAVRGYHVFNLTVHIITALLVWLVTRQTLGLCASKNTLIPFLAAALWLVNPVHTQSVTYIVQRMNAMAAMFFMLALFCYIRARMKAMAGQNRLHRFALYVLCLISAILGLASKQIVAILPAILLLYEWFFFQNLDRAWLKKKIGWICLVVTLLICIALIYTNGNPVEKLTGFYEHQAFTPAQRLLTQPQVVIYYLSLFFFPHPARLIVDYDFPLALSPINPATVLPSMLALLALAAVAVYMAKRHRLLSFTIFWFLMTLVIESSYIGLAIIFEHRTYLPSVFPVIGFVWLVVSHVRPKPLAIAVLCVAIVSCGVWTCQRNTVWRDALTFWQDCARKSPQNARPANGVGFALQTSNQFDKALEWFQKSVRLDPYYDEAHGNIGGVLLKLNRPAEAIPHLQQAIDLNPENYKAYSNLGSAMHRLNRIDDAIACYRKSISVYPDYETAHNNLGVVLTEKGDLDGAIRHIKQALRINPGYHEPYNNLGLVMTHLGRTKDAIACYQQALELVPEYATAHFNLGTAWFQQQDLDRACHHLQQAARIDPQAVLTLNNLATVLVLQKKYDEAVDVLIHLTGLRPESPTASYNLACVYALQEKKDEAVTALKKAVGLGYNRWDHIRTDPDLENIRNTEYFKNLTR